MIIVIWLAEVDGFTCGGADVLRVIKFVWTLLDIIFIIVPIGLILMIGVDFGKNVIASREDDMKKNTNLVLKRIIFCLALFLINPIVNAVVGVLSDSGIKVLDYAKCVKIATTEDLSQYEIEDPVKEYPIPEPVFGKDNNMTATDDADSNNNSSGDNSSNSSSDSSSSSTESNSSDTKTILVGDSRTIGISNSLTAEEKEELNIEFIAKESMGYAWLKSTANTTLESKIETDKKYNIVFWLGVNDDLTVEIFDSTLNNYLTYYNSLLNNNKYNNSKITVVSVTKLAPKYKGIATNSSIANFNKKMEERLDDRINYCDISSKITVTDQNSDKEGLHYHNEVYKEIMNEIKNCL